MYLWSWSMWISPAWSQKHSGHHRSLHALCLGCHHKRPDGKTIAKVFYKRFIMVFGAPAKLLSDWGRTNFTSVLVEELCAMFGIQKCQTTVCHLQCNGQVEHFHQALFRMIGKLASDKKVQ